MLLPMSLTDFMFKSMQFRRWGKAERETQTSPTGQSGRERTQARRLRRALNNISFVAEKRMTLPMIEATVFPKMHATDWSWRPSLWREQWDVPSLSPVKKKTALGDGMMLFHDGTRPDLSLRQVCNTDAAELAPFGFRLDVSHFEGSFLSLAMDLPGDVLNGLKKRHLIRMDAIVEIEEPLTIYARLNIKHGPNTAQLVRELPLETSQCHIEFDLFSSDFNEKRLERMWVDLIFGNRQRTQLTIHDLVFSRCPRAEV